MNMADQLRLEGLRGELKLDEPMARYVTWRAGGRARRLYRPADLDDLIGVPASPADARSRCCSSAWARICWCATAASPAPWC